MVPGPATAAISALDGRVEYGPAIPTELLDSLPCTVFMLERGKPGEFPVFTFVSSQAASMLGVEPAELILDATLLLDRVAAEDAQPLRSEIARAFTDGGDWRLRFELRVNGQARALECHGRVLFRDGEPRAHGCFVQAAPCCVSSEQSFLWSSVFEQSADGIMICGADLRIRLVNPAFERITGYSSAEVVGHTPRLLQSGRQNMAFYRSMWSAILQDGRWSGEVWNRRKNGDIYAERLIVHAIMDRAGKITSYLGVFSDQSQHKEDEARIHYLAEYDALTDLPNRSLLMVRLRQLLESACRSDGMLGVLSVDLNHFSTVNDSLGHAAGDELLKTIAHRLKHMVRNSDMIARMGADEFVVVLGDARDTADVAAGARKILGALGEAVTIRGQTLAVSASIGVCVYPHDGVTAEDLMRNASAAMNRAKRAGRNSLEFYTPEMNTRAARQLRLENELREAIERHQLVLHYQPQIDLVTGQVVGLEALVRWRAADGRLIPPGEFIPLAQERGLILPLGRWVIGEAVRQIAEWDSAGLRGFTVAVNLTAAEFHNGAIVDELTRVVDEHGVAPSRIELELTESIAVQDVESTRRTLYALHGRGFQLSLDDFGTGYSSLAYLRRFPIDKIKIDRSFVSELATVPGAARIVRAIISLARSFEMKVIAEGVETLEQLHVLRAERCDQFQGFLASPPLPAAQLESLLRKRGAPF